MGRTIYYFSGTGNSLFIARKLKEKLGSSKLEPIAKIVKQDRVLITENVVGFVFPLYYWSLPDIVVKFINKLEFKETSYIFTVITRGTSQGRAFQDLKKLLTEKFQKLSAGYYIWMPTNYIPVFEVPSIEHQKRLFGAAEEKISNIVNTIKEKRSEIEREGLIFRLYSRPVYRSWVRDVHTRDLRFVIDKHCNSCEICEKVCPVDNIEIKSDKPSFKHHCQQCFACMHWCPKEAIQVDGYTVGKTRYHHPDIDVQEIIDQKMGKFLKKYRS